MADNYQTIPIEHVKIGMFVKLDLSWFEHSFPTSSFKIADQKQIEQLRKLNIQQIRYVPSKSDLSPRQETFMASVAGVAANIQAGIDRMGRR